MPTQNRQQDEFCTLRKIIESFTQFPIFLPLVQLNSPLNQGREKEPELYFLLNHSQKVVEAFQCQTIRLFIPAKMCFAFKNGLLCLLQMPDAFISE